MNDPDGNITFDIETLINECQPSSILVVGNDAASYTDNFVAQKQKLNQACSVTSIDAGTVLSGLNTPERYDVGIVADTLEFLDKDRAGRLIARLRDLYTTRFVAIVRMGELWEQTLSVWKTADLLGYGMKLVSRYDIDSKPVHLYKYDITTYKKKPEWLNPTNWANPELWDKFRW